MTHFLHWHLCYLLWSLHSAASVFFFLSSTESKHECPKEIWRIRKRYPLVVVFWQLSTHATRLPAPYPGRISSKQRLRPRRRIEGICRQDVCSYPSTLICPAPRTIPWLRIHSCGFQLPFCPQKVLSCALSWLRNEERLNLSSRTVLSSADISLVKYPFQLNLPYLLHRILCAKKRQNEREGRIKKC